MIIKDEGRKMKKRMNFSLGVKFQRTSRKLITLSLNLHNHLQGPPDDSSDSDEDSKPNRPPKIPPRSSKRLTAETLSTESKNRNYHFDLKLKPELVPQWDGNPDVIARWISKINHLANNSPDIRLELGKIVPRRFTQSAETWYYSIPDAERSRIEEN